MSRVVFGVGNKQACCLALKIMRAKRAQFFRIIDHLVFSGLIGILKTKFCLHCVRQEV